MTNNKSRSLEEVILDMDIPAEEKPVMEVFSTCLPNHFRNTFYKVAVLVGLDHAYTILSKDFSEALILEIAQKLGFYIRTNLITSNRELGSAARISLTDADLEASIADVRQNLIDFPSEYPTDPRRRDIPLMKKLCTLSVHHHNDNPETDSPTSVKNQIFDLIGEDIDYISDYEEALIGQVDWEEDSNLLEDVVVPPKKTLQDISFLDSLNLPNRLKPSKTKGYSWLDYFLHECTVLNPTKPTEAEAEIEPEKPKTPISVPNANNSSTQTNKLTHQEYFRRYKFRLDMEYQIERLEGSERLKQEVIRRFERLVKMEEPKKNTNWPPEKHMPRQTAAFLKEFASNESLKFATHDYDEHSPFVYMDWLQKSKSAWDGLNKKYPDVPYQTSAKLYTFLFQKNMNDGWGYDKIKFGWSYPEVEEWCTAHPGEFPASLELPLAVTNDLKERNIDPIPNMENLCKRMAHEIRFRGSEGGFLERFLRKKCRELGLTKTHSLHFEESLRTLDFYVDIERFSAALKQLLHPVKERPNHKQLYFKGRDLDNCVQLIIHHEGSVVTRTSTDSKVAVDTLSGNLKNAWNNLRGHCNWSMEATFDDGKKRIHYLPDDLVTEDANETEGGVLHTLTFIKPE